MISEKVKIRFTLSSYHDTIDDEEDLGPSININMECVVEEKWKSLPTRQRLSSIIGRNT